MNRRHFLVTAACAAAAAKYFSPSLIAQEVDSTFEVVYTKEEWQAKLTNFEYKVMREEGTERPGSSDLLHEKRVGVYDCKGCDLPLYDSSTKYDSRTGWPSFYQSLPNAVETKADNSFFMSRTEVHCRRCGSHLGHIFNDGPQPTGKRHCLNGVSLVFRPA
ncbi:peptide-methionine (R)-S-oxide reductase MsrB [Marinomonas sp. 2405UD66-6]|uniref:peptide-methionine (R)-S-oxide reductase MsrB n=1 Tax=Marinomonas sp. 2405UD66-6 TaxID=3391834 RepID=UPI0039C94191